VTRVRAAQLAAATLSLACLAGCGTTSPSTSQAAASGEPGIGALVSYGGPGHRATRRSRGTDAGRATRAGRDTQRAIIARWLVPGSG
jgi:hypothetical protein